MQYEFMKQLGGGGGMRRVGGGGARVYCRLSGHISSTVIPLPFPSSINVNTRSLDGHWPVTGQVPTAALYKTSRVTIEVTIAT
jgi:hypothetical protein